MKTIPLEVLCTLVISTSSLSNSYHMSTRIVSDLLHKAQGPRATCK